MGKIITFYSFKGGVGRTMALANIAWRLAERQGFNVLAIDWDLEAPSLGSYFEIPRKTVQGRPGVLDFLEERQKELKRSKWRLDLGALPIDLRTGPSNGSVRILTAGKETADYAERLRGIDWRSFMVQAAVGDMQRQFKDQADVVLIDSRTGITDVGAICTQKLPDGVVLFTSANAQSWTGILNVADSIRGAHVKAKPTIWFCVSRIPLVGEQGLTEKWFGDWEPIFEKAVTEDLWRNAQHPQGVRTYRIPHSGYWTIGERLLNEGDLTEDPLARSYDKLTEALAMWVRRDRLMHWFSGGEPCDELKNEIRHAEARGDTRWLSRLLFCLGCCYSRTVHSAAEAISYLEPAAYLALGQQEHDLYVLALYELAKLKQGEEALMSRLQDAVANIATKQSIMEFGERVGLPEEICSSVTQSLWRS